MGKIEKWRLVALLALVMGLFSFNMGTQVVSAQTNSVFEITSISRSCDEPRLDISWISDATRNVSFYVTIMNTSSDWSDWKWLDASASELSWSFDHDAIDKVNISFTWDYAFEGHFTYDVGMCGEQGRLTDSGFHPGLDEVPDTQILSWSCQGILTIQVAPPRPEPISILVRFEDGDVRFNNYGTQFDENGIGSFAMEDKAGQFGVVEVSLWPGGNLAVGLIDQNDDFVGTNCDAPPVNPEPTPDVTLTVSATCDGFGWQTDSNVTGILQFRLYSTGDEPVFVERLDITVGSNSGSRQWTSEAYSSRLAILTVYSSFDDGVYGDKYASESVTAPDTCEPEPPVDPVLEIHNTVLACDGTVTFSVVDVNAIKADSVANVTLFHGATILDGPMQVQLSPGVADYSTQVKSSDEWPEDHLVRAQVSWAPETQSNGVIEPGTCDAPPVEPEPTESVVPSPTPVDPTPTPTEPVVPSPTPIDPTPTVPGGNGEESNESTVVIELLGIDAVGAPFGVYTAAASNLPVGAYYTGTVSADNTITIPDLLPGTYRIVIDHPTQGLVSFTITVDETTEDVLVLQVDLSATGTPTVQPDGGDKTTPETTPTQQVDALPSTGTGAINGSMGIAVMLTVAATALLMATGLGLRFLRDQK